MSLFLLYNMHTSRKNMSRKDDKMRGHAIPINNGIILVFIALSLCGLPIVLASGLAPNTAYAISSPSVSLPPNNDDKSISSSQGTGPASTLGAVPPLFPPPSGQPGQPAAQISASTNKTCTLKSSSIKLHGTPQQTEGPYFVDGMPNRSDIRSDPSDGSVQQGLPLHLVIHVYDVDDGSCTPLKGARVDIWHANPQGLYSAVKDQGTTGKKFLRGYQVTDNNGTVRFITIYPGWYQGRAIHIHDKVRTFNGSEKTLEWTSQLYLNNSINQQVSTQSPYSNRGPPDMTNEQDGIYTAASTDSLVPRNSGEHLMLNLTKDMQFYLGTFNIVLNFGQSKH
jgi:protocatechuate 3,4-dioxygenase beta subunit